MAYAMFLTSAAAGFTAAQICWHLFSVSLCPFACACCWYSACHPAYANINIIGVVFFKSEFEKMGVIQLFLHPGVHLNLRPFVRLLARKDC